jgi:hypothetical protein
MSDDRARDAATPAEQRLLGYLDDLRADRPTPGTGLVPAVVRSARWQRAVRPYALSFGRLVGAIGVGIRLLAGRQRSR